MASQTETERTNRRAITLVQSEVLDGPSYIFREQETSDFGIDAHVELVKGDEASGELIALQIKGGRHAFRHPAANGWHYPVTKKHARYWLNHSLPVVLVLADLDSRQCYWQVIDSDTLVPTGKNFKVFVPQENLVTTAAPEWRELTRRYLDSTESLYEINRQRIPPLAGIPLDELRGPDPRAAASLAADLAAGRADPAAALRELRQSRREWMDRRGALPWSAYALYAREHGEFREAADAFKRLADLRPERRATDLGDAALMLLGIDDEEARVLAEEAFAHDPANAAALVAMAFLFPDEPAYPGALEGRTDIRSLGYFANMASRRADDSEAIRLFSAVLDDSHVQSGVRLELSRLYCRRYLSAGSDAGDLILAREMAVSALEDRRRWTDDTAGALAAYARTLALGSRHSEALQAVTSPPNGSATTTEASSTEVARIALEVAHQLDRIDLLPVIAKGIANAEDRELAMEEARLAQGASDEDHVEHERNALERAVSTGDAQLGMRAALRLALLGVDATDRATELDPLESYVELLRAIAASRHDAESNLPMLRVLAKTEITAAEVVVQILLDKKQFQSAVDACAMYYAIYANPSFISSKVRVLFLAKDAAAAVGVLEDALTKHQLDGEPRVEAHRLLGHHYADLDQWDVAVHHLRIVLNESPRFQRGAFWNLVYCLSSMGDPAAARSLVDEHRVEPVTETEIGIWLRVVSETGWNETAASFAVTLSLSDEISPKLATSLAAAVALDTRGSDPDEEDVPERRRSVDLRPIVDEDVRRRAFEVMASLSEKHGDELGIRRFEADAETLLEELKTLFPSERQKSLRMLARQVALGVVPLGMICDVRNDPYGLLLAGRYQQTRVASSADGETHGIENAAAGAARNGRVVVDLSAVELALHLGAWEQCEGQFNVIQLTTAQRIDSQRSVAAARTATAAGGTLGVDADGNPYMTEHDPDAQLDALRRCEDMERATRGLLLVDVGTDFMAAPRLEKLGMSAWTSSLEAASRLGVPLWSDDVAQRRVATDLGIPNFGTVNLLEEIRIARITPDMTDTALTEVLSEQHTFIQRLMELRVADQPVSLDDILQNIAAHPDELAPAADVVARPAWWSVGVPVSVWMNLLAAAREHAPDYARAWQARGMTGILAGSTADLAPQLVATLAVLGTESEVTVEEAVLGFGLADHLCARHDVTPASAHVAGAVGAVSERLGGRDPGVFAEDVLAQLRLT